MKTLFSLLCICIAFAACSKRASIAEESPCFAVHCTMDFQSITVYLSEENGQPAAVDSIHRLLPNGRLFMVNNPVLPEPGHFTLINDKWTRGHLNQILEYRLQVFRKGKMVVDTPYRFTADCCHISKISGADSIRIAG